MSTTTRPTINATARRSDAVRTFLAAKAAKEAAEAALKEARDVLLRSLPDEGGEITVDGVKVTVFDAERREIDVNELHELVSAGTFTAVTKAVIDLKEFDAFVATGDISDDVVDAVVTIVPVPTVRVKEVK